MKKSNVIKWVLLVLVALAVVFAAIHLSTRTSVPENALSVEYQGKTTVVDMAALATQDISGELVNGKGERREISGKGCSLSAVLEKAVKSPADAQTVTAVAADEFRAEVSSEEWNEDGKVCLLLDEDGIQMVVFGDSNSKRNVRNLERLIVE